MKIQGRERGRKKRWVTPQKSAHIKICVGLLNHFECVPRAALVPEVSLRSGYHTELCRLVNNARLLRDKYLSWECPVEKSTAEQKTGTETSLFFGLNICIAFVLREKGIRRTRGRTLEEMAERQRQYKIAE